MNDTSLIAIAIIVGSLIIAFAIITTASMDVAYLINATG